MKASAVECLIDLGPSYQIFATVERPHSTLFALNRIKNLDEVLAVHSILADVQVGQRRVLGQFFREILEITITESVVLHCQLLELLVHAEDAHYARQTVS